MHLPPQLAVSGTLNPDAKGVLTVFLKKCTNLEASALGSTAGWAHGLVAARVRKRLLCPPSVPASPCAQNSPDSFAVMTLYDPNRKPIPTIEYKTGGAMWLGWWQ